eukprot:12906328-Prorocentrum_lima.AAC.1
MLFVVMPRTGETKTQSFLPIRGRPDALPPPHQIIQARSSNTTQPSSWCCSKDPRGGTDA